MHLLTDTLRSIAGSALDVLPIAPPETLFAFIDTAISDGSAMVVLKPMAAAEM